MSKSLQIIPVEEVFLSHYSHCTTPERTPEGYLEKKTWIGPSNPVFRALSWEKAILKFRLCCLDSWSVPFKLLTDAKHWSSPCHSHRFLSPTPRGSCIFSGVGDSQGYSRAQAPFFFPALWTWTFKIPFQESETVDVSSLKQRRN